MGFIQTAVFWLIIILGILIFLKLGRGISFINRLFITIAAVLVLLLLFFFISTLIAIIFVIILVVILLVFINRGSSYLKRIKKR